jgi:hypothetical protein
LVGLDGCAVLGGELLETSLIEPPARQRHSVALIRALCGNHVGHDVFDIGLEIDSRSLFEGAPAFDPGRARSVRKQLSYLLPDVGLHDLSDVREGDDRRVRRHIDELTRLDS